MVETLLQFLNKYLSKIYPLWLVGKVPVDKFMHFVSGAIGGFIVALFLGFYAGVTIMAILAFAKEAYDAHNTGHTSDVWDWVATTLGAILGAGLWQLIYHL
jgi:VanZ family protein